ncbi:ATP-binding protein [Methylobacterium brachiatum]
MKGPIQVSTATWGFVMAGVVGRDAFDAGRDDSPAGTMDPGQVIRLVALACVTGAAAWACTALTYETGRIASIWVANAVLVAVLLRAPRRNWMVLLAAGLAGDVAGNLVSGDPTTLAFGFAACNGVEILLCVAGLRWLQPHGEVDLTRPRTLMAFCLLAVIAPMFAATLAAVLLALVSGVAPFGILMTWYPADALGLLAVTPLLVSVRIADLRGLFAPGLRVQSLLTFAGLAVVLTSTFLQGRYPLLFLVFPALVFVAFRLGFAGVAVATAMTSAMAVWSILHATGPLALIVGSVRGQVVVLQIFLALMALMSLQIAATLAERQKLSNALNTAKIAAETAQAALVVSEGRYRTLVDTLPQKVWLARPDGEPIFVNGEMTAYHGNVELEPLLHMKLVHPEDLPGFMQARQEAMSSGTGFEVEARLIDRHGNYRWHRLSKRPMRDENGDVVELVGAALDIDDLRRTQDALVEARDRAEAAGRAKADFLANMSHELRTPLTAVIGASELLLSGYGAKDPAKQRRYLEMQRDAGTGLLDIINDILDFSKIEAGQLDLESVSFVLSEMVEACRDVVSDAASRKGIAVTVDIAPTLATRVSGDPLRVRQVLLNLLSNAVKFTPQGGSIRVEVGPASEVDGIRFAVSDSGIGIAQDRLSQLFDRFTQAETSTSRRFGGSGLGLAISRRLVEAMGGTFTVTSVPGEGSVFAFSLVLKADQVVSLRRPVAAQPLSGTSRRLLLAEDSVINQKIIGAMLRQAGHEVMVVGDGAQAVAAARHGDFDLILMDVQMPEVDGYEATREIRQAGISRGAHPIPIIALTANALSDEPDRCRAAGMDLHVAKPVDWPVLMAAIESLTAGAQSSRVVAQVAG